MSKKKGTGLRFTRVNDFILVPRRMIEMISPQVDPDVIYRLGSEILKSPLVILGVFCPMNTKHEQYAQVKGFMWASINPITQYIDVSMLALDEEYRGNGFVSEVKGILMRLVSQAGLKGIKFATETPEVFESAGAVRSKSIIMEVKENG